jgi:hypothetical protein
VLQSIFQSIALIPVFASLLGATIGLYTVFAKDLPPVLNDAEKKNWDGFDAAMVVLACDSLQTLWNEANWWVRTRIAMTLGGNCLFDAFSGGAGAVINAVGTGLAVGASVGLWIGLMTEYDQQYSLPYWTW